MLDGKADVSYFVFKFSKKKKSSTMPPSQTANAPERAEQSNFTQVSENYEPPPLSWHLTRKEQNDIKQVSCDMRSGRDLNENTTNWKSLMQLLRTPGSTTNWTMCTGEKP